jgi:hypothetical protein
MVDLSQNGLNFLAEIVAQMKAVYEAIGTEFNYLGLSNLPEGRKAENLEAAPRSSTGQLLDGSQLEQGLPVRMPAPITATIPGDIAASFPSPVSAATQLEGFEMGAAVEEVGTQGSSISSPRYSSDVESGGSIQPDNQSPADDSAPRTPSIPPISRNLLNRYNREDIYDRVWRKPIWQVAKDLDHTEHALCNACIKLYIPTPPRGWRVPSSLAHSVSILLDLEVG